MRYVIALGGNALGDASVLKNLSKSILRLARSGNEIVITHGNGPQVGELAALENKSLAVLTAQTQAELGLELENSMMNSANSGAEVRLATVLTRTLVDGKDIEFKEPSKPIGPFLSEAQARRLAGKGLEIRKLIHGYRRVVPSPKPKLIMETGLISHLLKNKYVVIAAGGGGIAVVRRRGRLSYADAVIDKDAASSLLATKLNADKLFILTNVDGAFIGFNNKGAELIGHATVKEMQAHMRAGQFEKGSMLPKVSACVDFIMKTGKPAAIGNLRRAKDVFESKRATVITR